jgi:predicted PurR-regulated permease PerM
MNLIHRRTVSMLTTILVFVALLALIYQARRPLISFTFAILFAYLLNPLVSRFQTWFRGSRGLAVAATYLLMGVVITVFGITVGPRIFRQGKRLVQELPVLMENVGSGQIAQQFGSRRGWDSETQLRVQLFLSGHRETIAQYAQLLADRVGGLAANLIWLLLIPVFAAFLLNGHEHISGGFLKLLEGSRQRRFFTLLLKDLDAMLATFIRAQLTFAALGLVAYTSFLLLAQFPYAFVLGTIAGLLEFIPFVGPLVTILLIMGMAVLTEYRHWLIVLVFLLLWRGIEDYVISPSLIGRRLKLHPLAVLFGVLVAGEIGGVPGLFLAAPIIASLRIIWKATTHLSRPMLRKTSIRREFRP